MLSWNKFLRSLLHFVVARSGHNEGLLRINIPPKVDFDWFYAGNKYTQEIRCSISAT
jgi:hypothetical protein